MIDAGAAHQVKQIGEFARKLEEGDAGRDQRGFAGRLARGRLLQALPEPLPAAFRYQRQQRQFVGEVPVHRAVIDAGVAGEIAQADRLDTFGLEPHQRGIDQRLRQVSMPKRLALRRRLRGHFLSPH